MDLVLFKTGKHVIEDHKANGGKILQYCDQLRTTLHLSQVTVLLWADSKPFIFQIPFFLSFKIYLLNN